MSNLPDSARSAAAAAVDGEWTHARPAPPVPNTSLLPGSEKAPTPAVSLRDTVRSNPMLSVAAALVLGAWVARLGRSR